MIEIIEKYSNTSYTSLNTRLDNLQAILKKDFAGKLNAHIRLYVFKDRLELGFDKSDGFGFKDFYIPEHRVFLLKKQICRTQPLIKAIVGKGHRNKIVLDLTAGFGLDAIQLALFGFSVICVEKNPLIYSMLRDLVARIGVLFMDVALRIRPILGDSKEFLDLVGHKVPVPEIVYLDPLFPGHEKRKTAQKKYMQIIRNVSVGDDQGEDISLIQRAMDRAKEKVVLKRPTRAEVLEINGKLPISQVHGRGHRFDVYVK